MRTLFFITQICALIFTLPAGAGLISQSYATCTCNDVDDTIKSNTAAINAVNRKIDMATSQKKKKQYLLELQQISLQSSKNLAAAYASCTKKEAACRAEQNAAASTVAAQTASIAAASARSEVQTERKTDVPDEAVIDEAAIESRYAQPAAPIAHPVAAAPKATSTTVIVSSAATKRVGGKTFAEVDVLPAFKESFADDPLMSPGVTKGQSVDALFSLDQIAVHEGEVVRGGGARSQPAGGGGEVQFRVYGAADRVPLNGDGTPYRPEGRAGGLPPGGPGSVGINGSKGSASSVVVKPAAVAKSPDGAAEEAKPRGWLKYLPKFIADRFFKSYDAVVPKKRQPASERSQIAGMHTDIFYNVNRAYMLAGDSLKR